MIDNDNRLVSRVEEVFNVWDYVLFGIMLAASCIIGIFLAWKDSKEESKQTTKDYLLGEAASLRSHIDTILTDSVGTDSPTSGRSLSEFYQRAAVNLIKAGGAWQRSQWRYH